MRISLRVEFTDGTEKDVMCSAKDLVAFEEKFSRSVARFEQEMRLTDLLFLAWHSENRTKATDKNFDSWLDEIESITSSDENPKSKG
jgi:hypothetical protein